MAVYEYTFATCRPTVFGGVDVGGVGLSHGSASITGIRAKLASGKATFNISVGPTDLSVMDNSDLPDMLWHYRAEDLGTPAGALDGSAVAEWYSYGADSTGLTGAGVLPRFAPTSVFTTAPFYKTGTGPSSGEGVQFDGSSDILIMTAGSEKIPYDGDLTAVVVLGDFNSGNQRPIIGKSDTGDSTWRTIWGHKGGDLRVRNDSADEYDDGNPDLGTDEIRIMTVTNSTSSVSRLSEYVDGVGKYTNQSIDITSSGGWSFNAIGGMQRDRNGSTQSRLYSGSISELILFEGALATEEREIMEGYLAHKHWGSGQANPLAAAHPYKSTNPYNPTYELGTDITLATSYGTSPTISKSISNLDTLYFYLTEAQDPGELTVELTVT